MTITSLTQLSALLIAVTCAGSPVPQDLPPPAVVDLGHPLSDANPTWSGRPVFKHATRTSVSGILIGSFETDEHFGTHVDAPAHFVPGGWTVDQIPVIRFVLGICGAHRSPRPGAEERGLPDDARGRPDVRAQERRDRARDHRADHDRLGPAVERPGTLPQRARRGAALPWSVVEAAQLLVQRDIAAIGIDTPSADDGPSTADQVHHTTLPRDIYNIENVANLAAVPTRGFTVVVAPVNVKGGSGAPARVFAVARP